jgi:hypothetical protein
MNERKVELPLSLEMSIFESPIETPLNGIVTPLEIVIQNRNAIQNARVFLFLPDGGRSGVFQELGIAGDLGRPAMGFISMGVRGLGKEFEGQL